MDASSFANATRQRAEKTARRLVDIGLRKHLVDKGLPGEATKQHQTVRVAMRILGHVVLAPIALIAIVLAGVVLLSVVAVTEPVKGHG
jgi:hypothetical protein